MSEIVEELVINIPECPDGLVNYPRELRTPHTCAAGVLADLDDWWAREFKQPSGNFTAEVFGEIWETNCDPDAMVQDFILGSVKGEDVMSLVALIPAAMCAQAIRTYTRGEKEIAWSYAVDAALWWGTLSAGSVAIEARRMALSDAAKANALVRLANDPKQKEKALVKECWVIWQRQSQRYKGNAAFARDMLQKFETLTSQPVIERWCRDWQEESGTQPAK